MFSVLFFSLIIGLLLYGVFGCNESPPAERPHTKSRRHSKRAPNTSNGVITTGDFSDSGASHGGGCSGGGGGGGGGGGCD